MKLQVILKPKDEAIKLFKNGSLAVRDNERLAYELLVSTLANDNQIPIKFSSSGDLWHMKKVTGDFVGNINPDLYSRITKFFNIEYSDLSEN